MAHFDPLLERNRHLATTNAREGAAIVARHPVYVITCLDPRTDPSAFLELALGDARVGPQRWRARLPRRAHRPGLHRHPGPRRSDREDS